jgi:hypothetical protein
MTSLSNVHRPIGDRAELPSTPPTEPRTVSGDDTRPRRLHDTLRGALDVRGCVRLRTQPRKLACASGSW